MEQCLQQDQTEGLEGEGFVLIDLPTVVDIEYDDGEMMTHLFDQSGRVVGFWYRGGSSGQPGVALRSLAEVAMHHDQRLVDRVQRCTFVDGSSPLVALGIAHRYVDAYGSTNSPQTLEDVVAGAEILEQEIVHPD